MTQKVMTVEERWRSLFSDDIGGAEFDKPGGGYSFSAVLAEERELAQANVAGDPSSALLCLSIADPTWKMDRHAFKMGEFYYMNHPDATRYTDNSGVKICPAAEILENTHSSIASYLNQSYRTGKFDESWVQYSPGSIKRLLSEYVPKAFFDPNSVLVFPTPGYGVIKDPKNNCKATVIDVPMICENGDWDVDYVAVEKKLETYGGRKKFLYLNMPHNPTGSAYTHENWVAAIDWAKRNDVTLIVDEAYTHLRFGESASVLEVEGWESHAVVLQSVSKGWNATGLRFGWIIAHPTVIKAVRLVMDVKDSGLFGPSIAMGLACLKRPDIAVETMKKYQSLHAVLAKGLADAGFASSMPQAGLCQFTPAPRSAGDTIFGDSAECAKWFRKEPRISLMHYSVNGKPWLRWAVTIAPTPECGLPNEAAVIDEVVRRLKEVTFVFD